MLNIIFVDSNLISNADFFATLSHKNKFLKYIDLSKNKIEKVSES